MLNIPAIDIYLGTTNCCVGKWLNGRVEIIPNDLGERTTPSCVSFDGDKILVGEEAKFEMIKNDKNTVYDAKRLIGRKYNDVMEFSNYRWSINEIPKIQIIYQNNIKKFRPEEISVILLLTKRISKKIKKKIKIIEN